MTEPTIATGSLVYRSTAHASLAALGVRLRQLDLFGPVRERVRIPQKTVRHTPTDKLYDALIALLAGAPGLVEINPLLRAAPALQAAFGRPACAEQSVVQDTLDACTAENVTQLEAALAAIYRRHGQGCRHDYARAWQILDVDLSGLPCGKKAALATSGYWRRAITRWWSTSSSAARRSSTRRSCRCCSRRSRRSNWTRRGGSGRWCASTPARGVSPTSIGCFSGAT